jgi:hypothetical protein
MEEEKIRRRTRTKYCVFEAAPVGVFEDCPGSKDDFAVAQARRETVAHCAGRRVSHALHAAAEALFAKVQAGQGHGSCLSTATATGATASVARPARSCLHFFMNMSRRLIILLSFPAS